MTSGVPRFAALFFCSLFTSVPLLAAPRLAARVERTSALSAEGRECTFSPDAQLLATTSIDGAITLRRVADGRIVRTLVHPGGATAIRFSGDGQLLATGGYDGLVRIWRTADGMLLRRLAGHRGTVWSVAIDPGAGTLASSGEDNTIRIWRYRDGALLRILRGHARNVWSIAFSPDGRLLASGSFDRTLKLWRVANGALIRSFEVPQAVVHVAFNPAGDLVAGGGDDSTVRIWRVHDGALVRKLACGSSHVYSVAFSPDGRWLASGGRELSAAGTLWKQLTRNRFIGARGTTIRLWRVADSALVQALDQHTNDVVSVAFSPDGKWLASSSEDHTVKLWRLTASR